MYCARVRVRARVRGKTINTFTYDKQLQNPSALNLLVKIVLMFLLHSFTETPDMSPPPTSEGTQKH
jgi:hypothetical protein